MSRQKKNRRHRQQQHQQQAANKKQGVRRYIIPLAEWKRYEQFKSYLPQIEEALADLQENWNSHVEWLREDMACGDVDFEEMHDNFVRLSDLLRGAEPETQDSWVLAERKSRRRTFYDQKQYDSSDNYVRMRPKKNYENMVAEIIIEDISDGKL